MTEPAHLNLDVGLALSGGGARCFAQIGALKAMDEEGIRVGAIAANSSAAIIGALYASGRGGAELERIARGIDFSTFLDLDGATGLIGHGGVEELLREHAVATFEELSVPLAVPTVDIERAEVLVFRQGPLGPPVCASNAFPGLFTPIEYRGRFLMDGGMVNNFPVDLVRTLAPLPVVAVDVRESPRAPVDVGGSTPDSLVGRIRSLFGRGVPTSIEILMKAYNITQDRLISVLCALYPPDLHLRPALPDDLGVQDFDRREEALDLGYGCVKDAVAGGRFRDLQAGDAA